MVIKTLFVAMDDMEKIFDLSVMKRNSKIWFGGCGFFGNGYGALLILNVKFSQIKKDYAKYNVSVIINLINYIQGLGG